MHGNFIRESYAAIRAHPAWRTRLEKRHTHSRTLPELYRDTAAELDSCMSSDALLMNFFCYPGFLDHRVARLFGVEPGTVPNFGVKARIKINGGKRDSTEIDMQLGPSNIEAKFTEADFTSKPSDLVESYADFETTFEKDSLETSDGSYCHYQLIRNVLAVAPDEGRSFFLILDARRPDLLKAWWAVHSAIRQASLRTRCGFVLWQELAQLAPSRLRTFARRKYGLTS
jgi:hypothetical protein